MISRGHDMFSKNHINNPRKWWQKSKRYFKKYEDKSYPCEDQEYPQEINDNILYPHWKKVPENKAFNNDQEDIEFKDFEENIMNKFGLIGQTHLKEEFYLKYNSNEKWSFDD